MLKATEIFLRLDKNLIYLDFPGAAAQKMVEKLVFFAKKTMRKVERTAKEINQINKVQFVSNEKCY